MQTLKKSKFVIASAALAIGVLAVSESAHANYTRSCPQGIRIDVGNGLAGLLHTYYLPGHSIVANITAASEPSGNNTRIERRKAAKGYSAAAGQDCINAWNGRAIDAVNAGQVDGKVVPPSVCKTPSLPSQGPYVGDMLSLVTTAESVDSIRWAYVTNNNSGFYEVLGTACATYGSGNLVGLSPNSESSDGECASAGGHGKTGWYTLHCTNNKPTSLTYFTGDEL